MSELSGAAKEIAAKATGLRTDQIDRAVTEYRKATDQLHAEPEWRAIIHMCGSREAYATYGSPETMVTLEIQSWKERDEWHEQRKYGLHGKAYESYGEARTAELLAITKFKPYSA